MGGMPRAGAQMVDGVLRSAVWQGPMEAPDNAAPTRKELHDEDVPPHADTVGTDDPWLALVSVTISKIARTGTLPTA